MAVNSVAPRARDSRGRLVNTQSIEERFQSHVDRSGGPDACWTWTGSTQSGGRYGEIKISKGKKCRVHRLAWELVHGPIPKGMHALHHCDVGLCVKTDPDSKYPEGHLFLGTHTDNVRDCVAKRRHSESRKTHCPKGHKYAGGNLYVGPRGTRNCRACKKAEGAARWIRRRAALSLPTVRASMETDKR